MSEFDDVMKRALETGKLYVGSEIHEALLDLPTTHKIRFLTDSGQIQVIKSDRLEPTAVCA